MRFRSESSLRRLMLLLASPIAVSVLTFADVSTTAVAPTFEDRIAAQRAIEEVYWSHRIWPVENPRPKPSLSKVMPAAAIRTKVEVYLTKSSALEALWQRPLTAGQLQAEVDRMARQTRDPAMLRELFAALRNDPVLIAETLGRQVLVNRLIGTRDAHGARSHDELRRGSKKALVSASDVTELPPFSLSTVAEAALCDPDTWTSTAEGPDGRILHTAVWTGTEMIVWGGRNAFVGDLDTGGRYDPTTDSWTATSITGAPLARSSHTAIWTGSEMIVWGGAAGFQNYLETGGRYSPLTDSWIATSTTGAPEGRVAHTAVWTGTEMIVWGGGLGATFMNSGARYDPITDSWTATRTTSAPTDRWFHTAVWTGSEMIVWGGGQGNGPEFVTTGGRYDPIADSWTATSTAGVPTGCVAHTAVWTGSEMIVWGGADPVANDWTNTGGRYDPSKDAWIATPTVGGPEKRSHQTAIWTGTEMIVWGGDTSGGYYLNSGGRYDPTADSWTETSPAAAPEGRIYHKVVWTGSEMIIWGGFGSETPYTSTGGRYCVCGGATTDGDFDGVGDACDNCVSGPNPAQGPAPFGQSILATDAQTFSWPVAADVVWAKGHLAVIQSYAVETAGWLDFATSLSDESIPAGGAGFWYLVRPDCPVGSWQSDLGAEPGRDGALP